MITVPKDTFLAQYMEYMSSQETPTLYDLMCGCWCLSVALGRHTIVDRPRAPVHMNMYMCLVSESGIMRKSTAVRIATGVVRQFMERTESTTILFESKFTMGMMQHELSKATSEHGQAHVIISASELAAVLARSGGLSGVPALLTDLYDCPDVRVGGGTLSSGSFNLRNVYASFLGGSTPTWLARAVSPDVIEGGFTSRCYFIIGRVRKRSVAWPQDVTGPNSEELVGRLMDTYNQSLKYSNIGITDAAKDTFTRWYNNRPSHRDPYRESFEAREDAHVLRFAGLFAANECAWQISNNHLERAIETVREIKRDGAELFSGVTIPKDEVAKIAKIRTLLLSAGTMGLSKTEIYREVKTKMRSGDMNNILTVFHELDLVKAFEVPKPMGRPKTQYVATKYLRSEAALNEVSRKLGID